MVGDLSTTARVSRNQQKFKTLTSENSLPYVPSEKDLDQFIAGFEGSKYCPLLQLLKETVTVNKPAKKGLAYRYKISDKLIAMTTPLLRKTKPNERIWNTRIGAVKIGKGVIK